LRKSATGDQTTITPRASPGPSLRCAREQLFAALELPRRGVDVAQQIELVDEPPILRQVEDDGGRLPALREHHGTVGTSNLRPQVPRVGTELRERADALFGVERSHGKSNATHGLQIRLSTGHEGHPA